MTPAVQGRHAAFRGGVAAVALGILLALALSACGGTTKTRTVTRNGVGDRSRTTTTTTDTTAPTDTTATTAGATTPYTETVPTAPVNPVVNRVSIGRFFSPDSPWNTNIESIPADQGSQRLMKLAQLRPAIVEEPDGSLKRTFRRIKAGLTINVNHWTDPIYSDAGGTNTTAQCRQLDCGPDAVSSIVLQRGARPDPRFDGWMTNILTGSRLAYDFWRGRRLEDGVLSYQYVKKWDLNGPGFQAPGNVSARGSGLPLFAGIIRPEEIRAGRIDHALSIAIPGAAVRRYVQPASSTDGNGPFKSVPEGARLRLRNDFRIIIDNRLAKNRQERRAAGLIVDALQRFGAIVVDRSAAPTIFAQRNANWHRLLPLNLLQNIPLRDFEVVQLPSKVYSVDRPPNGSDTATGLPQNTPASTPAGVPGVG